MTLDSINNIISDDLLTQCINLGEKTKETPEFKLTINGDGESSIYVFDFNASLSKKAVAESNLSAMDYSNSIIYFQIFAKPDSTNIMKFMNELNANKKEGSTLELERLSTNESLAADTFKIVQSHKWIQSSIRLLIWNPNYVCFEFVAMKQIIKNKNKITDQLSSITHNGSF